MTAPGTGDRFWIPDNPDGSGWAEVDWVSASRGSRRTTGPSIHPTSVELSPQSTWTKHVIRAEWRAFAARERRC